MTERPIIMLEGDVIALGPLRRDLVPTYQRWINDLETLRTLGASPQPMTFEAETEWYDNAAKSGDPRYFTIYERANLRAIGTVDLCHLDARHGRAEMGIMIGERDARGKGFGTETVRLLLDYAFTVLGLHNVMLEVYEHNHAARRAYQKAGFREIGRRREAFRLGTERVGVILMDCLATEFESPWLAKLMMPD